MDKYRAFLILSVFIASTVGCAQKAGTEVHSSHQTTAQKIQAINSNPDLPAAAKQHAIANLQNGTTNTTVPTAK